MLGVLFPVNEAARVVGFTTLDDMQAHVGGSIQAVPCVRADTVITVNEDGHALRLANNELGTQLLIKAGLIQAAWLRGPLLGAILVTGVDDDGRDVNPPRDVLDMFVVGEGAIG